MATKTPVGENWDILSEDWGQLVIQDDILVRVRAVLTHIENNSDNSFGFRSSVQVEAMAPEKKRGPPGDGKYHENDIVKRIDDFKKIKQAESIYRLSDSRLLVLRYRPQIVSLTNKFNKHGEPVLGVKAQTDAILMDAPTGEEK